MRPKSAMVRDWEAVRLKMKAYPWAERIAADVKEETDWWVIHYRDNPARIAGWGHNYFCDKCHAALVFDAAKPDEHRCSQCGLLRDDDKIHEAWTYSYRSAASVKVFHAAVLYGLHGDDAYLTLIRRVLGFYAEHFESLEVRTPAGFEGRFSGINLADAVSICWMLNGMELIREHLTDEELELYYRKFFGPMADFLHRKPGGTPNICIWMKSALGMIGLFFEEREWCRLAAEGEEGIDRWLDEGLLPQGFWYESSFHYHFYCLEGITYYAAFCRLYDYDAGGFTDAIRRMYRYPIAYAFPDGKFPSPNDGWPLRSFASYAHQYEWIRNSFDEAPFRYALAHGYDDPDPGAEKTGDHSTNNGGLPRLLFGTDWRKELETYEREHGGASIRPSRTSRCDEDVHYVMLQNEQASVFMKYGYVIREHSHADVMNFELFAGDQLVSRDISNSGYGSDLFKEWQRKTIAHNTVMVDRLNQPNRPAGQMLAFDAEANYCRVAADEVYLGVRFERELQLLEDRLLDQFTVILAENGGIGTDGLASETADPRPVIGSESHQPEADEAGGSVPRLIDWLFHCSGEPESALPLASAEPPGDADGYQLMLDVKSCAVDGNWEVSWVLPDKRITLEMAGEPGTTVYLFRGYEHSSELLRWGVMVRRSSGGSGATFKATYRIAGR